MRKLLRRLGLGTLGLLVLLSALGWLLLESAMFSPMRRSLVEDRLSKAIGQPLIITKDVRVFLAPISRFHLSGVEIPSQSIAGMNLARLDLMEFDLDLIAMAQGRAGLDNLVVQGARINLLTQEDGTTSWTDTETDLAGKDTQWDASDTPAAPQDNSGILAFLRGRTAQFTSVGLKVEDRISGFSFDFDLDSLSLAQLDGGRRVGLNSKGLINGHEFGISGNYPQGAPFTTEATFGDLAMSFDGQPIPASDGGGFRAVFDLKTGDIGDLLEVLKLQRVLEGDGTLSADVESQAGRVKVDNLSAKIDFAEGQVLTAKGSIADLAHREGLDLEVAGRLHPEDRPPPPAGLVRDIRLAGFEAQIVGQGNSFELRHLEFQTNAFENGLERLGPASIAKIHRTPDGRLAMDGITLKAGPADAPILEARGYIHDVLQLKDLAVTGKLDGAATLLLPDLTPDQAGRMGRVEAQFKIDDTAGHLGLSELKAQTLGTDLWELALSARVGDVRDLEGMDVDFDLQVADTARLLSALDQKVVDAGALDLSARLQGNATAFTSTIGLTNGNSHLKAALDAGIKQHVPVVRGSLHSDLVRIDDFQDTLAAVMELVAVFRKDRRPEAQPLVLPKDDVDVQPLVLPKDDTKVQPLVLPKMDAPNLLDPETLLTEADVEVAVDIRKITGQKGVSSVSSTFRSRDGKASLGPLEVSYGGGYFNLDLASDLVNAPLFLSVSGSTRGWQLQHLLSATGVKLDADGTLGGPLNVRGNIRSLDTFLDTMRGSATISMAGGHIATSLLELAGLGVVPWLFSPELRHGSTRIVCVRAPLRIDAGRVSSDQLVAETARVQVVAKGSIDWLRDTISLRAEPRPVGKPLDRSAWPIDVTGMLTDPQVKLQTGGARSRRADGADNMPADRKPCVPDIYQLQ
ncbi:AsmA family protein [Fluviibacterium sp. DFM31]|uniref:AsmA family protein n=1 Tax=Meridianimarinicoccus marinus TaxID=3231483 RepID=A0ABV3LA00_9RHOB